MIIDVDKKIEELSNTVCDICEHFPLILKYGIQCDHITELGVREVGSLWGWIGSRPKTIRCYDKEESVNIVHARDTAESLGIDFQFYLANVHDVEIEETDLLFIDTDHAYYNMKTELTLHGNKARKFIMFHDTAWAEDMNQAIQEFMQDNPHWVDEEEVTNNHGMKIIKRLS